MADYYSQATIMPFIKDEFVTEKEKELLRKFGFDCECAGNDGLYFYAYEFNSETADEETENDLIETLVKIFNRSNGALPYLYIQGANTCSKMRPDSHGGFACVITKDGAEWFSTHGWLEEKLKG